MTEQQENQLIGFAKWLIKWLLIVISGVVFLIVVTLGGHGTYKWFVHDRHAENVEPVAQFNGDVEPTRRLMEAAFSYKQLVKEKSPQKDIQAFLGTVEFSATKLEGLYVPGNIKDGGTERTWNPCPENFPILIGAKNNSDKTIMSITIEVEARIPGRSTNVISLVNGSITQDYINPPKKGRANCYSLPLKPEYKDIKIGFPLLEYRAKVKRVSFESD